MEEARSNYLSSDRLYVRALSHRRVLPRQEVKVEPRAASPPSLTPQESDMPSKLGRIIRCRCVTGSIVFLFEFCSLLFWIGDLPAWLKVKQHCSESTIRENSIFYVTTGVTRLLCCLFTQILYVLYCCITQRSDKDHWVHAYKRQKCFTHFFISLFCMEVMVANLYILPQLSLPRDCSNQSVISECEKSREIYKIDLFAQFVILVAKNILFAFILGQLLLCSIHCLSKRKRFRTKTFIGCILSYGEMPLDYIKIYEGIYMRERVYVEKDSAMEEEVCLICFESFKGGEKIYRVPCKPRALPHYFHRSCLKKWGKHSMTCPKCRTSFKTTCEYSNLRFNSPDFN